MMKIASAVPFALAALLAVPAMGCAVSLPEPELTATAQSRAQPGEAPRGGSGDSESASSGAPSGAALSLQQTADDDESPSALAPLEDEELAGTAVVSDGAPEDGASEGGTPDAEATGSETPQPPTATPAPEEPTSTPEPTADASTYPEELLTLLNQYRAENGIAPLQYDATLTAAAMDYARYMAESGFFGHYPPTGSTPAGRIAAAGFRGTYKGEALSAGQSTPGASLRRLVGSPAHAGILLEPSAIAVGIGHHYNPGSYYGHYWVVVTGNP